MTSCVILILRGLPYGYAACLSGSVLTIKRMERTLPADITVKAMLLALKHLYHIMSATDPTVELDDAISAIGHFIPTIVFETGLFGIYTLLFVQSTYILLQKDLHLKSIWWMLTVTGLMYILSATHWAVVLARLLSVLHPQGRATAVSSREMGMVVTICTGLNLLLGDAVVIWRVWILWGRDKYALTLCSLLFLSTLAMTAVTSYQEAVPSPNVRSQLGTEYGLYLGTAALVSFCLSLATNLWSTSLIAYKAWHYRRNISAHIRRGNKKSMVEKVLWITAMAFWNLPFATTFKLIMPGVLPQISGIYPTTIVVLVCLQKTHCERQFTYADLEVTVVGAHQEPPTQNMDALEAHQRPTTRSDSIIIIGRMTSGGSGSESNSMRDVEPVEVKLEADVRPSSNRVIQFRVLSRLVGG
ncbi:hypothetical protein OF83DRAFT_1122204 [Amylostereum chailletii]|nr:hypothetical protein OF83DRAFT_1122204 [Amylostereum chailletii]